jgi:hypothetical protein
MRERDMAKVDPQNEPIKQQASTTAGFHKNKFASPATKKATVAQRIGITGGGGGRGQPNPQLR